jgi:hypothetical protein
MYSMLVSAKLLICCFSRPLQPLYSQPDEESIETFLYAFGPSARDYYAYRTDMEAYRKIVEQKIRAMSWKTVTDLLMERPRSVSLDEGSHRVILINPDPETRFDCIPTIVAKPVGAMLLEQDSQSRWRNSHHLYQSLRQDPKTRSSSGWAMEAAFHALCTKGVDFKLHPMSIRPGGRTNDLYTNSMASTPLDLSLPVQELVVFEGTHLPGTLEAGHYYRPVFATQPSYDSFLYQPAGNYVYPIQVTNGKAHEIKTKGIHVLLQHIQELGLPTPTIRFIVVIPAGDEVTCTVSKMRNFFVEMFCLEVQERELFVDSN